MIPTILAAFLLAVPLSAQDNGNGSGGDDGTDSFFEGDSGGESPPSTSVGGEVELDLRAFPEYDDFDEFSDSEVTAVPRVKTEFTYEGSSSEVVANLEYSSRMPMDSFEELIDEAYIRLFYDNLDVQAGYLKTTWGTGDAVHVVDVLNPKDFTDSINPEYADRKIAEKMVKLNIYTGPNGLLELAYVPTLTQDRYAIEGRWVPYEVQRLEAQLEELVALPTFDDEQAAALAAEAESAPAPNTLSHGQYGLRYTTSVGGVDIGGIYYFGFIREPVIDISQTDPTDYSIHFDRLNLFGLEFATVIGGFNLRAEAAYNMTEDFDGDDPSIHNHSIAYMGGFDRDLPVSNLNVNIQGRGEYLLANDEVSDNGPGDVDYDAGENENYWTNTLVASLEDSYRNETITPSVDFLFTGETQDFVVRPGVEFVLADDATVNVRGSIFEGDKDTEFGQFDDNDHVEVSFEYAF
ncbi:MAG: hypothetical protein GVY29_11800 [Spirochaetes bacterium]|nr:hypothetical protein [Spirochaetota bacterium]